MYSTEKILIDLKNEIIKFPTSSSEIAETYSLKIYLNQNQNQNQKSIFFNVE